MHFTLAVFYQLSVSKTIKQTFPSCNNPDLESRLSDYGVSIRSKPMPNINNK